MHKLTLITVGSLKTSWIKTGCEDYLERLRRVYDVEIIEVPASKQKESTKQKEEECSGILKRFEKLNGVVWALDETGTEMTSLEFSKILKSSNDSGEPLAFILGGAYGLTDEIKQKADRIFALSQMTFPHEFCRLVFLEQLYRASEIQKGSGYHH